MKPAWKVKVKVTQLCQTLCNPTDYTVHGILQATILEWVTFPFSRESFQPRDQTQVSCIAGRFFTSWGTRKALFTFTFTIQHQFSSVQFSRSVVSDSLHATPWIIARQASLSITNSRSSPKLTSIESVMPSSHLILRHPLFLLPPIPPSIRVFSSPA